MTETRGVFSLRLAGILSNADKWVDLDAVALNRQLTTAELPAIGYISGGYQPAVISNTEKVNYSDDTISAVPGGNLTQVKGLLNSVGDTKHGYFSGGIDYPTVYSNVDKLEYATETMGASPSNLTGNRHSFGTLSNNTNGYIIGGTDGSSRLSGLDKIEYATDTASNLPGTFLKYATDLIDGTGNNEHGYLLGGVSSVTTTQTMWNKLYYSTDTLIEHQGSVYSVGRHHSISATSSLTDGYFMGGYNTYSSYDPFFIKLNYATGNAFSSGHPFFLNPARDQTAATGSSSTGYCFGGHNNGTFYSSVNKINFSNDTYQTSSSNLGGIRGAATATSPRETPLSKLSDDELVTFGDGSLITNVGYFGGGEFSAPGSPSPSAPVTTLDKLNYSNDTTTYTPGVNLTIWREYLAATGNLTHGYFSGGRPSNYTGRTEMNKVSYSTDTTASAPTANLRTGCFMLAATGNLSAGYFGGGDRNLPNPNPYLSLIQKVTYSTDSTAAVPGAALNHQRRQLAATGNQTAGYFGGGENSSLSPSIQSLIERVTYSTDTTAVVPGANLSEARSNLAATGNSTHGYFSGGLGDTKMDKLTYSTDTTTYIPSGNFSVVRYGHAATGNSTAGYFGGGNFYAETTMDKVTYSNDTRAAVPNANLSQARTGLAAASSQANAISVPTPTASTSFHNSPNTGYFGGGVPQPAASRMDKLTYSTDTTTYTPSADLAQQRWSLAATGNSTAGYFGGGDVPSRVTIMEKLNYSNDTTVRTPGADLSQARNGLAAVGNQTTGYFGGGFVPSYVSTMDKLTYSIDMTARTPGANLPSGRYRLAAVGNQTTGYFSGGSPSSPYTYKLPYSTDTITYTPSANLSWARYLLAATGNSTHGYFGGGSPSSYWERMDKLTYSTDTTTYIPGADLNAGRDGLAATGNSTHGYFGGGGSPPGTRMEKLTYSSDTIFYQASAYLSASRDVLAATSSKANGLPSSGPAPNNI